MLKTGISFLLSLFLVDFLYAQGTEKDYQRAEQYVGKVSNKMLNSPNQFFWLNEHSFYYINNTRSGNYFIEVDVKKNSKKPLFDHQKLAASLSTVSGNNADPDNLPLTDIVVIDKYTFEFAAYGKKWSVNKKNALVNLIGDVNTASRFGYWGNRRDDTKSEPVIAPDSNSVAIIKNYNVYVYAKNNPDEAIALTKDGHAGNYYGAYLTWSPDSKKLATYKVTPTDKRTLYLIESSPVDQLQPKLLTRDYMKPGDDLPQMQPVLLVPNENKHVNVDISYIPNQYNLSRIEWRKDSRSFTFEFNKRGHQQYSIFDVNAANGEIRLLINETSPTFIDYSGKKYRKDIDDGREIIWMSERDGWNHLYLFDGETGVVKNQITKGEWVVRKVVYVDEVKRFLIIEGSGRERNHDPYFIQYYKVNFDGSGFTALTSGNANHVATFSKDYSLFVDYYSRVDSAPVSVLRSATDGKPIMELERADISELEKTGWKSTEVFTAKGRDGVTDIWGIITRPTNFDPQKKYPVIEYIYAGPHSSFVPKSFSVNPSWLGAMAELGFIVVQIDGMGTSNRSKAFHNVAWRNLKDAGFPDRILWMRAAAEKYPYMDLDRVGIYGTSAGGQSAAGAVLFYPEFYKVAVSSCGCHDNRMDKIWWNEQWMGYPVGSHYAACSNTENAFRLEGKLLLIVGELDDNVDPSSTYQFVNALIKNKKDHEFIMVPGMGHSSGGDYGERKRRDFFVKHLLGVKPPAWK